MVIVSWAFFSQNLKVPKTVEFFGPKWAFEFFEIRWTKPDASNKYYALSVLRISMNLREISVLILQFWNLSRCRLTMLRNVRPRRRRWRRERGKGPRPQKRTQRSRSGQDLPHAHFLVPCICFSLNITCYSHQGPAVSKVFVENERWNQWPRYYKL